MKLFLSIITIHVLSLIHASKVYAHEEGATKITVENALGPALAFVIIIAAIIMAKRINKQNRYDERKQTN